MESFSYEDIKKNLIEFTENFKDNPLNVSGWGHNYFCEVDGTRLTFNDKKPKSHQCSTCGESYNNEKFNKTWVYLYRYRAFETAYKAAVLYKINPQPGLLDIILKILLFYGEHYHEFEIHAKDKINPVENGVTGFGKIMPQGLNEGIMLITIVNIMELVKADLDIIDKNSIDKFINEVTKFLFNQRADYHNIICWIDSAIGCAGVYLKNERYIDSALNSKYGLKNQLDRGLTKDFIWYEGSVHYHYFTVEGILNFLIVAESNGYSFKLIKELVRRMLISVSEMAFDNLIFPNPNDGWPNISLKTYSFLYDAADKIYKDKQIDEIINNIRRSNLKRQPLPLCEPLYYGDKSLNQLLYSNNKENENNTSKVGLSKCYVDTGFSIIKNKTFNLFMKYANKSESHAHRDLLNIEITINNILITHDLSNPGYGSKLYDEWYVKTLSHNTVIIGGEDQLYTENSTLIENTKNRIKASVLDAYKDTLLLRDVDVSNNKIHDTFYVEMGRVDLVDFMMHFDAELIDDLDTRKGDLIYDSNGYQHLFEVEKVITNKGWLTLSWLKNGLYFKTEFNLENKDMFICRSYDNPSGCLRRSVILRSLDEKNVKNEVIYSLIEGEIDVCL